MCIGDRFKVEQLTLFEAKDDLQTLQKYLYSVRWKLGLAGYHMSEALAAIPSAIPEGEPDKHLAAFAMHWNLMPGHEEDNPMELAQLKTEAHTIAAAQALHSVPDILMQALYLAFRLDLKKPMREGQRTAGSVIRAFEETGLSAVSKALKKLVNSETYRYLRALVNVTKHRRLIDYHFYTSLVDLEDFGLSISAFRYEDQSGAVECWPSKSVKEFLTDSLSFLWAAVDAVLKTAESLLASFAGSPAETFWLKRLEDRA